jgi:hypothetical protein
MTEQRGDQPPDVLYFVHVPKCAGTTVEEHFQEHLPPAQFMRPEKSKPVVRYLNGRAWCAPASYDPAAVRVLCGHFFGRATGALLAPHNQLEAILIRDPVGLYLSWYNYRMTRHESWGRPIPKFEDWYRSQGRNPVARHLLARHLGWSELRFVFAPTSEIVAEARRALDSFWFVGEYRHVDTLLDAATEKFGVPARAPQRNITQYKFLRRDQLSEELAQQVRRENAIDQYLSDRYSNRLFDPSATAAADEPSGGRLMADEVRRLTAWLAIKTRRS